MINGVNVRVIFYNLEAGLFLLFVSRLQPVNNLQEPLVGGRRVTIGTSVQVQKFKMSSSKRFNT